MPSSPGTVERRVLQLSWGAAFTIVGTLVALIVARRIFVAAHRPLSWAAAAVVAAVLLDPVVDRLSPRLRRAPAVLLTLLLVGSLAVGTTYLVFDEVSSAIDRLEGAAPDAAATIEDRDDQVGEVARDFRLGDRIDSAIANLQDRVAGGDDVLRSTAGTAPTYLVGAILTLFILTYGPRMAAGALAQDPDRARRERVAEVVGRATVRARGAVYLTLGSAVTVGLVVAGVAFVLDLPAPSAIGFTAGVLSVLPHVGLALGCLPLLLLTLAFRSGSEAVIVAGVVVAVQVADSIWARRMVAARTVDVGLLVPWVVALLGYSIYGVGGAAYGLAIAVFAVGVLDELRDRPDAAPLDPAMPEPAAAT